MSFSIFGNLFIFHYFRSGHESLVKFKAELRTEHGWGYFNVAIGRLKFSITRIKEIQ
jgi:hypothetical protein